MLEYLALNGRELPNTSAGTTDGLSHWHIPLGKQAAPHVITVRYTGTLAPLKATADERDVLQRLPAMADSSGSYLPASSAWYPQLDDVPFTYTLTLDLPDPQRGIVPGTLTEETLRQGRYRARFAFNHPAEGITLMAGPYRIEERIENGLRLRTYFHPPVAELAQDYLDSINAYIDLYSTWIGPYPFSEFSIVSSPLPTGFGMPTLTYLGSNVLRLPFIRFGSLGHEILHNWWGNGVYVDWQRGNWSEGLTTFMADYTYKERADADAARTLRLSWLRDFAAIPQGQDIALSDFTARHHSASQTIGYHKAAFLFLMLRDQIGTAAFDTGLRQFWQQHAFTTAGWDEMRHAFEQSSGKNLATLFQQWLDRTGAPRLALQNIETTASGARHAVSFTLRQSAPAYTLRVPVLVNTERGVEHHMLELAEMSTDYTLETLAPPISLVLDPDVRLFRRLAPAEAPPILRQVINDPATQTVVLTADPSLRQPALALAGKLLDHPPQIATALPATASALVIGLHADINHFLSAQKLAERPPNLRNKGTAQVWVTERNGKTIAIVSVTDTAALQLLLRPLPHYGTASFLAFDHNTVIEHGVWPAQSPEWKIPAPG
ncbi:MAG: M1 family aminopeptidase [Gammaproteobacteria bacterium]|nr:M1 family aminopeptidase [Gammaproteobacteria bacterium]